MAVEVAADDDERAIRLLTDQLANHVPRFGAPQPIVGLQVETHRLAGLDPAPDVQPGFVGYADAGQRLIQRAILDEDETAGGGEHAGLVVQEEECRRAGILDARVFLEPMLGPAAGWPAILRQRDLAPNRLPDAFHIGVQPKAHVDDLGFQVAGRRVGEGQTRVAAHGRRDQVEAGAPTFPSRKRERLQPHVAQADLAPPASHHLGGAAIVVAAGEAAAALLAQPLQVAGRRITGVDLAADCAIQSRKIETISRHKRPPQFNRPHTGHVNPPTQVQEVGGCRFISREWSFADRARRAGRRPTG